MKKFILRVLSFVKRKAKCIVCDRDTGEMTLRSIITSPYGIVKDFICTSRKCIKEFYEKISGLLRFGSFGITESALKEIHCLRKKYLL